MLLPVLLILILSIVRMLLILNTWYSVNNAADIAVRAVALTGDTTVARQLVLDNLPGVNAARLRVVFTPEKPVFKRYVTPTPIPVTGKAPSTITPDPAALLDPNNIPDNPVSVEVTYDMQLVGPFLPDLTVRLGTKATARMEPRVTAAPTREFF